MIFYLFFSEFDGQHVRRAPAFDRSAHWDGEGETLFENISAIGTVFEKISAIATVFANISAIELSKIKINALATVFANICMLEAVFENN